MQKRLFYFSKTVVADKVQAAETEKRENVKWLYVQKRFEQNLRKLILRNLMIIYKTNFFFKFMLG